MGTTPNGLPYPEPTDAIAAGAGAIRALAENLRIATGSVTVPSGSVNPGTITVTFPSGLYAATPRVIAVAGNPYGSSGVSSASPTSAAVFYMWRSGSGAVSSPIGSSMIVNWAAFYIGGGPA